MAHPTVGTSALKAEGRYAMSDAPKTNHQRVSRNLFSQIDRFLDGKPCEPSYSPTDVFLPSAPGEEETVVQPDKVHEDGIHGTPDLVVEILSDSTALPAFVWQPRAEIALLPKK